MVAYVAVAHEALPNEAAVETIDVRSSGTLLVPAWLDLVFAQQNSFAMDLLKSYIRRWHVVVIDGVLFESVHRWVCVWASLIERLLWHDSLPILGGAVGQVRPVVSSNLEVGRGAVVEGIRLVIFISKWLTFDHSVHCYEARVRLLVEATIEF